MKIAFAASSTPEARAALVAMEQRYGSCPIANADVIVTLGGDGQVLKTFYSVLETGKPVFPLRRTSSIGFLCNRYDMDALPERISAAHRVVLHPLRADAVTTEGRTNTAYAVNDVTVVRDTPQSAKLRILVDGVERIPKFSGDGVLVATPAGSTAYNHSSGGPIMPLDANTLVMTAICGFRPRRWSYAVLPQSAVITIEALETDKRPIRLEAGQHSVHTIARATIAMDRSVAFTLLFDPDQHLEERIIREQFMTGD